jgi:iron(III) transport system ATP-binding protein
MAVSDRIIVMNEATIAQEGAPRELYEAPRDAFVASFMGDANHVRATLVRRDAEWGDVRLGSALLALRHRGLPDGEVLVAVRPEAITLVEPGQGQIGATVIKAAYLGGMMEYTLDSEIGPLFAIGITVDRPPARGARVGVTFAAHGVLVVPAGRSLDR